MVLCLMCFLFSNRCKTQAEALLSENEKTECMKKMLIESFPTVLFILVCGLDLVLGIVAVGIQIAAIQHEAPYYEIGCGLNKNLNFYLIISNFLK
jgi:hypothetical protein